MKNMIIHNFDRASQTYDEVATVQFKAAEDLVQLLLSKCNVSSFKNILDIGVGTGFLPQILSKYNLNGHYYLNDIAEQMLLIASKKLNHLTYSLLLGDIETNNEFFERNYDLIISNMSLQWIENLKRLLKIMIKNSNSIAFTTLGSKTFSAVRELYVQEQLISPTKTYQSMDELKYFIQLILKNYFPNDIFDCIFEQKEYFLQMKSFADYSDYTKKLGININFNVNKTSSGARKIINHKERFTLNYHILFVIILRK